MGRRVGFVEILWKGMCGGDSADRTVRRTFFGERSVKLVKRNWWYN